LNEAEVNFEYHFSSPAEYFIKFNNGWTVVIDHGLNYLQKPQKVGLGLHEYDLRPTFDTNIVISFNKIPATSKEN
jgi:hypothetical protein